jgi:hypothetical protein
MQYTLLFDGNCTACSPVAEAVVRVGLSGLVARSLQDAEIRALLTKAKLEVPAKPALLCHDGRRVSMMTGFRMRAELIRLLGVRRGHHIIRLATMEARARASRAAPRALLSRRQVLGAAATGAAGLALGATSAAAASTEAAELNVTPADAADVKRVLSDATVQQAIATYGPVSTGSVLEIRDGGQRAFALPHQGSSTITLVDGSVRTKPTVLALQPSAADGHGITFSTASGHALVELRASGGRVEAVSPTEAVPNISYPRWQIDCFRNCARAYVDIPCINYCIECANGGWDTFVNCPRCALCAGSLGLRCARDCFF